MQPRWPRGEVKAALEARARERRQAAHPVSETPDEGGAGIDPVGERRTEWISLAARDIPWTGEGLEHAREIVRQCEADLLQAGWSIVRGSGDSGIFRQGRSLQGTVVAGAELVLWREPQEPATEPPERRQRNWWPV